MYMSKKDKKKIAALFNSITLSREYWFDAVDHENWDDAELHHTDYAKEVVELADRFGIELCSLEPCKIYLEGVE